MNFKDRNNIKKLSKEVMDMLKGKEEPDTRTDRCDMSTQTILGERAPNIQNDENQKQSSGIDQQQILKRDKNPFEISDCIENLEENTFIREVRDGSAVSKSLPPSISSAMKALQNKIKSLEKENESLKVVNQNLEFELKSQNLPSSLKLIEKLTSTSHKLKEKEDQLSDKDRELSEIKIDLVESQQILEEYKAELEKVGDIETIKKRLENEKMARRQLVKEKAQLEDEYKVKLKSLEPELQTLRDKIKYLSQVNLKVRQAQEVTENFVQEVVSVNELLANTLRKKSVEIRKMSQTKNIRKSESCDFGNRIGHLSERNSHHQDDSQRVQKYNSSDTSCDSDCIKPNQRKHRFIESQKYSLKKRAFSSALSINNGYSLDGKIIENPKIMNTKIHLGLMSFRNSELKSKKHKNKNSLENEKLQIQKIEQDLSNLHKDYEEMCKNLNATTSSVQSSIPADIKLKNLLNQVETKASQLMQLKKNHMMLANKRF